MIIKRSWADDKEVDVRWHSNAYLAKHRLYLFWHDKDVCPCDKYGFRIPNNFENIFEKFNKSKDKIKIFCFGGSTTFGQYCSFENTYPHYLEQMNNQKYEVFNFGGCDSDARTEMYILVDLIRLHLIPDVVIFLDGINEKQGWFASFYNKPYEEINLHYPWFKSLMDNKTLFNHFKNSLRMFLSRIKKLIFFKIDDLRQNIIDGNLSESSLSEFDNVAQLKESYLNSYKVVNQICKSYSIQSYHILQPTVYDCLDESPTRYRHIKAFYNSVISEGFENILDISQHTHINELEFIDWQHLDKNGNKSLAESIFNKLGL